MVVWVGGAATAADEELEEATVALDDAELVRFRFLAPSTAPLLLLLLLPRLLLLLPVEALEDEDAPARLPLEAVPALTEANAVEAVIELPPLLLELEVQLPVCAAAETHPAAAHAGVTERRPAIFSHFIVREVHFHSHSRNHRFYNRYCDGLWQYDGFEVVSAKLVQCIGVA